MAKNAGSRSERALASATRTTIEQRSRGPWLGLAVGDALGAPLEFVAASDIEQRWGRVTDMMDGGPWVAGEWTDDTALAIATAQAYVDGGFSLEPAAKAMVEWLASGPKDVGNLTRLALGAIRDGHATATDAGAFALMEKPGSAGNGSLMRAVATGLLRRVGDPRLVEESVALSGITHADPKCTAACATFNAVLSALVHEGATPGEALEAGMKVARELHPDAAEIVEGVLAGRAPRYAQAPIGYVFLCLERALIALRDASSFEEGLVDVVNLGGDSDTNGAVAGALLGARFGEAAIPGRWLDALKKRDEVESAYEIIRAYPMHDVGPHHPVPAGATAVATEPAAKPGPAGVWEADAYASTAPLFPRVPDARVAATAKLLSVTLIGGLEYRVAFRLGFEKSAESIVTGVLDARARSFAPEGALASAFDRYREAPEPTALEEKARYEWWACHLIDEWVRKALENEVFSPTATWRSAEG